MVAIDLAHTPWRPTCSLLELQCGTTFWNYGANCSPWHSLDSRTSVSGCCGDDHVPSQLRHSLGLGLLRPEVLFAVGPYTMNNSCVWDPPAHPVPLPSLSHFQPPRSFAHAPALTFPANKDSHFRPSFTPALTESLISSKRVHSNAFGRQSWKLPKGGCPI